MHHARPQHFTTDIDPLAAEVAQNDDQVALLDVRRQFFLDTRRQFFRRHACSLDVLREHQGDFTIGTHRDLIVQFRRKKEFYLQFVSHPDNIRQGVRVRHPGVQRAERAGFFDHRPAAGDTQTQYGGNRKQNFLRWLNQSPSQIFTPVRIACARSIRPNCRKNPQKLSPFRNIVIGKTIAF